MPKLEHDGCWGTVEELSDESDSGTIYRCDNCGERVTSSEVTKVFTEEEVAEDLDLDPEFRKED